MTFKEFNLLPTALKSEKLFQCCGCIRWVEKMILQFPYESIEEMKLHSDLIWFGLEQKHWLEAFTHHPKIGDIKSLEEKGVISSQHIGRGWCWCSLANNRCKRAGVKQKAAQQSKERRMSLLLTVSQWRRL